MTQSKLKQLVIECINEVYNDALRTQIDTLLKIQQSANVSDKKWDESFEALEKIINGLGADVRRLKAVLENPDTDDTSYDSAYDELVDIKSLLSYVIERGYDDVENINILINRIEHVLSGQ